jgi:proteic killer suppression protein
MGKQRQDSYSANHLESRSLSVSGRDNMSFSYGFFQTEKCNIFVDIVTMHDTFKGVIKSFKHKGLAELFERGRSRKVRQDLQSRALRRLDALDQAEALNELNVPGFDFHGLQGVPKRYSIHVNGPWCITFEWENSDASKIDLEQYH